MKCALVKDNIVIDVVTTNSDEEFQSLARISSSVVDVTDANPQPEAGWLFNGNSLVPPEGQNPAGTRRITKLGLRRRLTFTELCTLTAAAKTVVQVEALMGNLAVATYIDLNRSDTIAGFGLIVSLGLVTQDRANEILSAPIRDDEKYKGNE